MTTSLGQGDQISGSATGDPAAGEPATGPIASPITGSITALLIGISVLLFGGGLQGTLLGVRATIESFPLQATGLIMSAYYGGYVAGYFISPQLVFRVGHIRAFAAFAAIASAAAIAHGLFVHPSAWFFLRFASGVCFAGLFMVCESWLNGRATNETRGKLLAVYMMVQLGALAVGQMLLPLGDPRHLELFAVASALISVGLVPVALTRSQAPQQISPHAMGVPTLYAISPLGVVGCFASGLALGAFWGMGPVFAQGIHLSTSGVASFMGMTILGGMVLQWPIGRMSDRTDRRLLIMVVNLGIAATSAGLAVVSGGSLWIVLALAVAFGGLAFSLYSLCVAHTNDLLTPEDMVAASSGLLLVYGVGAAVGPYAASAVMAAVGYHGLYAFVAAATLVTGAFAFYRARVRPPVPAEERAEFVPLPRTSPVVLALHPGAEPGPDAAAEDTGAPSGGPGSGPAQPPGP
jgi:MFS family permease